MKNILFTIIRVLYLRKGIWIRFFYNQRTREMVKRPYYKELFTKNQKQLMYLGTPHTRDLGSKYLRYIDESIEEFKPDCVIYEQYIRPPSWVELRDARIKNVLLNESDIPKLIKAYGESGYTDYLGRKRNIATKMIEPKPEDIYDHLLRYYKKEQLFLYHCLQFIIANSNKLKEMSVTLEEYFINHGEEYNPLVYTKTGIKITNENFFYYYKTILNEPFDVFSKDLGKLVDKEELSKYVTQKIEKTELYYRDTKVVEGIYELAKKYDKILVVYGNTHYLSQRKVIEKMFKWLL
jgi:hypothetical protein